MAGAATSARGEVVRLVFPDHELKVDFVVPTKRKALAYIRDGAINGVELLEEAGLTTAEAEAELERIQASA